MSFDLTITDGMVNNLLNDIMVNSNSSMDLKLNRINDLFIVKYKIPYRSKWGVLLTTENKRTLYDNLVIIANFAYINHIISEDKIQIEWSLEDIEYEIKNLKYSRRAYSTKDIWNILEEVKKFSPEVTWAVIDGVIRNYMNEKNKEKDLPF